MPFYKTPGGGVLHAAFPDETLGEMDTTERIRVAVLSERERCAKIAEYFAEHITGEYDSRTAYAVAEKIRKGE